MSQRTSKSSRRIRTVVRCAAFVTTVGLLVSWLPWPSATWVVPGISPFVGIAAALATRSLGPATLLCLPVLVLTVVRRRWFCRWACPVGLMSECAGRVSPISPARCKPVPRLGVWLALLSVSAAAVGYPMFLWLDPLAIFSGTVGLVADGFAVAAQAAALVLAAILVLSFALPGTWCLKLCPLGATQDLVGSPRLWLRPQAAPEDAPDHNDQLLAEPMSRRSLLTTAIGATCAVAGIPLGLAARARGEEHEARVLRPPGAAAEWQFGQLCLRCGNCVRSCPSEIITTRWHSDSWSNWLVPEVTFDSDYCREDCNACMEACPSGALTKSSRKTGDKPAMGLAHVLMDSCLLAQGRECRTMCLDACPYEAITLHKWTWEDDRRYPIVAAEKCPGCGACQVACTPMNAIVVRPGGNK